MMQIIIPMTGYGARFVAAGYKELKPFIPVLGKPIIEWIVKGMYAGEERFVFILKREDTVIFPEIAPYLHTLCPTSAIHIVDNWVKKGPVQDVLLASGLIADDEPAIINYCDFYHIWDWPKFKRDVHKRGCEGAVPCYTGFHPHLIPAKNLYASCLSDVEHNLIEIREKYSFAADKTKGLHSPGVYYFKTGSLLKKYCQTLIDDNVAIGGEYYASLPYNAMVKDGLKVWTPANVKYFCQWGTPQDLQDFLFWVQAIRRFQ